MKKFIILLVSLWEVMCMKIRDGFVTNSSSTSYIIISKKELTGEYLAQKLGVTEKTLNYYDIVSVCKNMVNDGKDGFYHHNYQESLSYSLINELFGKETANKYKKALKKGYEIYCGRISSDETDYEITMCLDYIKYSDSEIYIDATDNGW